MTDLPEKPNDDRHRLRLRWDSTGLEIDAKGFGLVIALVGLVAMLCWLFGGLAAPWLPAKP
jgi:hypothetical protein